MQVKDFLISYPDPHDEKLSFNIAHMKEFQDLKLGFDEKLEFGKPFKHQEMVARYYSIETPYKSGIIIHGVGTGKTCLASIIVERYKNSIVYGIKRRPALILVKNESLVKSFENEIANVCTQDVYVPGFTESERTKMEKGIPILVSEEKIIRRLRKSISKTYEIYTTQAFLEKMNKLSENTAKRRYSNRLVFIDEAHSYKLQLKSTRKSSVFSSYYTKLKKFLHTLDNSRIFLLTATAIRDKARDIASLLNMVLPQDQQLPELKEFDKAFFDEDVLTEKGESTLREAMEGKVTYIRSLSSNALKINNGQSKPWLKHLKVYPSIVSSLQEKAMKKTFHKSLKKDMSEARRTANCVYPIFKKNSNDVISAEGSLEIFNNYTKHTRQTTTFYSSER